MWQATGIGALCAALWPSATTHLIVLAVPFAAVGWQFLEGKFNQVRILTFGPNNGRVFNWGKYSNSYSTTLGLWGALTGGRGGPPEIFSPLPEEFLTILHYFDPLWPFLWNSQTPKLSSVLTRIGGHQESFSLCLILYPYPSWCVLSLGETARGKWDNGLCFWKKNDSGKCQGKKLKWRWNGVPDQNNFVLLRSRGNDSLAWPSATPPSPPHNWLPSIPTPMPGAGRRSTKKWKDSFQCSFIQPPKEHAISTWLFGYPHPPHPHSAYAWGHWCRNTFFLGGTRPKNFFSARKTQFKIAANIRAARWWLFMFMNLACCPKSGETVTLFYLEAKLANIEIAAQRAMRRWPWSRIRVTVIF